MAAECICTVVMTDLCLDVTIVLHLLSLHEQRLSIIELTGGLRGLWAACQHIVIIEKGRDYALSPLCHESFTSQVDKDYEFYLPHKFSQSKDK